MVFLLSPSYSGASNLRNESLNSILNQENTTSGVTFEHILMESDISGLQFVPLEPMQIHLMDFEAYITDEQHQNFQCTDISDFPPGYVLGIAEVDANDAILQFIPFDDSGNASFAAVSFLWFIRHFA